MSEEGVLGMNSQIDKLRSNGLLLKEIPRPDQTSKMCMVAIEQNPKALKFAAKKCINPENCLSAVKRDGNTFRYVPECYVTEEMCILGVKTNGDLLKNVPAKLRTKEVCLLAVENNPRAMQYIPREQIHDLLNEESPVELLNRIVNCNIEWLMFMPVCQNGVDICLARIKNNFSVAQHLPEGIRKNHEIVTFQKSQGKVKVLEKSYDSKSGLFLVKVDVQYNRVQSIIDKMIIDKSYAVTVEFHSFNDFYEFLDGNLIDAELQTYDFEGIELGHYNIEGAVVHSDILLNQGLYKGDYFEALKRRFESMDSTETIRGEIIPRSGFNYPRPVDDDGHEQFDYSHIPFFYVSDIHLVHRVLHRFTNMASKEEIRSFIKHLVRRMVATVGTIPYGSYLLIAGDTASEFEMTKIFYQELVRLWNPGKVVVILGNHELWDPRDELESNIQTYDEFFRGLGIIFLQNSCFIVKKQFQQSILNEEQILDLGESELSALFLDCSISILGGIGFSGFNNDYNAANMRYGKSFEAAESPAAALEKDKCETNKFNTIYQKLMKAVPKNKIIVLTHMQKWDWNEEPHNPNWVYLNGHNHCNYFDVGDQKVVYADNQIGYHSETVGLKYFYLDNQYDVFAYLEDGIYEITKDQYIEFNKGKLIQMLFGRENGSIHMVKRNDNYMFFLNGLYYKKSKNEGFYLLNGGRLQKLLRNSVDDLQYYFDNIDHYIENVNQLLDRYTGEQRRISEFIKGLGGSGKIHGCIIDVDKPSGFEPFSYCHLFVNPIDGKVTPYFAYDVQSRTVYKDFRTMLDSQKVCKLLNDNLNKREQEFGSYMLSLQYSSQLEEWGDENSMENEGSYLYKISRIIKSLQYIYEKGIVRIWNEGILNFDLVKNILAASRIGDMIHDTLIVEIEGE